MSLPLNSSNPSTPVTFTAYPIPAEQHNNWISLFSGKRLYYLKPNIGQIEAIDIATGLSMESRFAGQTNFMWSVAAHTLLLKELVEKELKVRGIEEYSQEYNDAILHTLLHDASEAYMKDIPRPLKQLLSPTYKQIEERLSEVILERFGVYGFQDELIHNLDNRLMLTEANVLLPKGVEGWNDSYITSLQPIDISDTKIEIKEYSPSSVKKYYLEELNKFI